MIKRVIVLLPVFTLILSIFCVTGVFAVNLNYSPPKDPVKKDAESPVASHENIVGRAQLLFGSLTEAKERCSGTEGDLIRTLGYYEAYDGGGAEYILHEKGFADDITVYKTNNGQYLELIYGDEINVLTVGLVADGNSKSPTDNQARLVAIADYDLFFPEGSYYISNSVEISRAVTWRGLHGKRNDESVILVCEGNGIVISGRGATVDGICFEHIKKNADVAAITVLKNTQYVTISNLFVRGFEWGLCLSDDCWGATINNCNFLFNKEGLYIKNDANEVVVRECYFLGNNNGIHTVSSCVHNLVIRDCLFQDQKLTQLRVETCSGVEIYCSGCYFENKWGRSVVIGDNERPDTKINHISFVGDRFYHTRDSEGGLYLGYVENAAIIGCFFYKDKAVAHDYIVAEHVDNLFMEGNSQKVP